MFVAPKMKPMMSPTARTIRSLGYLLKCVLHTAAHHCTHLSCKQLASALYILLSRRRTFVKRRRPGHAAAGGYGRHFKLAIRIHDFEKLIHCNSLLKFEVQVQVAINSPLIGYRTSGGRAHGTRAIIRRSLKQATPLLATSKVGPVVRKTSRASFIPRDITHPPTRRSSKASREGADEEVNVALRRRRACRRVDRPTHRRHLLSALEKTTTSVSGHSIDT